MTEQSELREPTRRYEIADLDLVTVKEVHRAGIEAYEASKTAGPAKEPAELLAIEDAVERMPDEDLDKARVIYQGLAQSDFPVARELVATSVLRLAHHDWEAARPLWYGLLRDPELEVAYAARAELLKAIEEQILSPGQLSEIIGLITEGLGRGRGRDDEATNSPGHTVVVER